MPTTTYYYDANLQAHVIERVDPQDDGLCEKALFYGPNARHMAWAFGRHYYDSSVGAPTPKEQAAADDAEEQGSARSGEEPPSSPSRERVATLFDAIAHGDDAHRAWLKEAIINHFDGKPVPAPVMHATSRERVEGLEAALRKCAAPI